MFLSGKQSSCSITHLTALQNPSSPAYLRKKVLFSLTNLCDRKPQLFFLNCRYVSFSNLFFPLQNYFNRGAQMCHLRVWKMPDDYSMSPPSWGLFPFLPAFLSAYTYYAFYYYTVTTVGFHTLKICI